MKKMMTIIAASVFATGAYAQDISTYKYQYVNVTESNKDYLEDIISNYSQYVDLELSSDYSKIQEYKLVKNYSRCMFDHVVKDAQDNNMGDDFILDVFNEFYRHNAGLITPEDQKYKSVVTYKARIQEGCLDYLPNKQVFINNKIESEAIGDMGCAMDIHNCYNRLEKKYKEKFNISQ